MQKRYITLFSLTIAVMCGIYFSGSYVKGQTTDVNAIKILRTCVDNNIVCSGTVRPSDVTDVFVSSPSIVKDILVEPGDKISKGDVIMRVKNISVSDIAALKSDIPEGIDISSIAGLQNQYSDIIKDILTNSDEYQSKAVTNNLNKGIIFDVTAPADGVISSINAKNQGIAQTSAPVACISKDQGLEVLLSINESKISEIKEGQSVLVTGAGFKGSEYKGHVSKIAKAARQSISAMGQESVVDVTVKLNLEDCPDVKPGFTAKCKILTSSEDNIFTVPYDSVLSDEDGSEYCYKYINGKAVKSYIQTGKEFDSGFKIIKGISDGDIVVSDPMSTGVNNGDKISVKEESAVS